MILLPVGAGGALAGLVPARASISTIVAACWRCWCRRASPAAAPRRATDRAMVILQLIGADGALAMLVPARASIRYPPLWQPTGRAGCDPAADRRQERAGAARRHHLDRGGGRADRRWSCC